MKLVPRAAHVHLCTLAFVASQDSAIKAHSLSELQMRAEKGQLHPWGVKQELGLQWRDQIQRRSFYWQPYQKEMWAQAFKLGMTGLEILVYVRAEEL